ncbi:hypothetical protein FN846DRAFT_992377 [Sphaerosporella brunnea]|uniref:Uncharacterized protein n=1 Tax=Sphaerosporella brunnea TaxID=1250544 RepID=A0A5J5EM99_9PEZI|nr:hypothetical protein FN846DRAFT_992377 [Sphaerosporella brunnea]
MPRSARKSILKKANQPLTRRRVKFSSTAHHIRQRKDKYVYYIDELPAALQSLDGEPCALHDVAFDLKSRYNQLPKGVIIKITVELPRSLEYVRWPQALILQAVGVEEGAEEEGDDHDDDYGYHYYGYDDNEEEFKMQQSNDTEVEGKEEEVEQQVEDSEEEAEEEESGEGVDLV